MKVSKEYPLDNEPVTQTLNGISEEQQNTIEITETSDLAARVATSKETKVYEPRPLNPQDPVYDKVMEQFGARPVKPKYWFEEFGDYWSCSCGHINSGPICEGCGLERDLLRKLFILHKPQDAESLLGDIPETATASRSADPKGTSADERSSLPQVRPVSSPEKLPESRKPVMQKIRGAFAPGRRMVLLVIVLALLAAGGGGYYYNYAYKAASGETRGTISSFTGEETYDDAFATFDTMGEELTSDELMRKSYISVGDNCLKKGKYKSAVKSYKKAQDIKDGNDVKDKINSAKYGYIKANIDSRDDQLETYLSELKKIGYPGITELYDKYYAWHMSIIANGSETDFSTAKKTFHRSDTVYYHISLTGGEPNEKIKLYYTLTWPGGEKETRNFDSEWKSGSKITAHFSYPVAMFGAQGKMVFKVFDSESNGELGSCTVNIAD